MFVLAPLVWN